MGFSMHPDQKLKCLLISPKFPPNSFWNYVSAAELMGAKTPSPPLGLLTVAALLPQHWDIKLMDLNVMDFRQDWWQEADIICVGGMLPQQQGLMDLIKRANADGKFVVVGGPEPSSQPDLYADADVTVVGEAEELIHVWLDAWRAGNPRGVFKTDKKPDVSKSPLPRFDLLDFRNYVEVGLQYSRGCPFNCEFCDIIELYGRVPRTKTPEQVLSELQAIYDCGYRGSIYFVDDNFIGNKRNVKKLLPHVIDWQNSHGHPFYFATEASMNLGDDMKLLEMMQSADFRFVFMGIETPDPEILMQTQKSQNTMRPIVDRVNNLYKHGIVALGGFILGFDSEKPGTDKMMIKCIEDTAICMASAGLLVALPNTQLTRRLQKEGRMLDSRGKLVPPDQKEYRLVIHSAVAGDHTVSGLNFVTKRPQHDILREYRNVIAEIYSPRAYFGRVLETARRLKTKSVHIPSLFEWKRNLTGLWNLSKMMLGDPALRWHYLSCMAKMLKYGPGPFDAGMKLIGIYTHFYKHSKYVLSQIDARIANPNLYENSYAKDVEAGVIPGAEAVIAAMAGKPDATRAAQGHGVAAS
ncbi:MAG: hypothetical protein RIQ81_704 [Pseudomonadota bacterium]|jgi:radical SAM superfamily enzyme YgiQ (UPF0313 family)